MKSLIFIYVLFFLAVSARKIILSDTEIKIKLLGCIIDNYGKDPRDMSLDHNQTQIMSCYYACEMEVAGLIYDDGSLNEQLLEEKKIENTNYHFVEVFTETYYQCRKDYPDRCDWELCFEKRMPPPPIKNMKTWGGLTSTILANEYSSLRKIN
ncbi:hypothetical protein TKK_0007151 [Trichogramma kaykai]|uniref:Uncharacterized protein n=1 Tax=Trichogramma kaykai TaxID=54128 RepID=A0ABD2X9R0_9HYME